MVTGVDFVYDELYHGLKIICWDRAAENLYGYTVYEVCRRNPTDLLVEAKVAMCSKFVCDDCPYHVIDRELTASPRLCLDSQQASIGSVVSVWLLIC
uniref:PAS domain-containing protein n=1 Tax=Tanacetum cinerariifolium TaxID=118510 RepID=A0A699GQ83_TANCI|nr:hypothetical protein [Tanacetum cinerariifolium]